MLTTLDDIDLLRSRSSVLSPAHTDYLMAIARSARLACESPSLKNTRRLRELVGVADRPVLVEVVP